MLRSVTDSNASDKPSGMSSSAPRILIIDDSIDHASMVQEFLLISGFQMIDLVHSVSAFWKRLAQTNYDCLLLDYRLPDGTGLDIVRQLNNQKIAIPVIMVTGIGDEGVALEALKLGAAEYVYKTGDYLLTLPRIIRRTVESFQLQQSLERSLETLRYQSILLNNVRDAVVVWDLSGNITYWNPAATALYGWSAEERLGLPVEEVYLHMFSPDVRIPGPEHTTGRYVERQCQTKAGKNLWVSSRLAVLRDARAGSRLIGYIDIAHDISRDKQAEQALRESEARYRAIVEDYQTEMICRFTPQGLLTFANEIFNAYFNLDRQQSATINIFDFLPEDERLKVIDHLSSINPNHKAATFEHLIILPGGQKRWVQRTDRAIFDTRGQVVEFQCMGRDITERKQMEEQIRVAQAQLTQATRLATLGELASGVAHQINNPLTTIIADSQLLLRQVPETAAGRESAEAILQAGWRLQEVVQHLLEFSRPSASTLDLVNINTTIQRALHLVRSQIVVHHAKLEVTFADNLPPVYGNARQLEDLWINLLLLARDATLDGQDHTIEIITKSDLSDWVQVEIRDDGQPIPRDQLSTIFEPNFIGPAHGRGSGLELSICREMVRQHQGQIESEVTLDDKTIFRVSLPVRETQFSQTNELTL
jgi:PAS domain S-box-containing protein